jgi:hypothetical protein
MTSDEGSAIMSKPEDEFMDRLVECQLLNFLYEKLYNKDIRTYFK